MFVPTTDTRTPEMFPWNASFETGIPVIDEQHKKLAELVNRLAVHFVNDASNLELRQILEELEGYAHIHFADEDEIWRRAFKDDPWLEEHDQHHRDFERRLSALKEQNDGRPLDEVLDDILSFLINWLAFHILENDMRMTKAIHFMEVGQATLPEAKVKAENALSGTHRQFVQTILAMYSNLSARIRELTRERVQRRQNLQSLEANQRREQQISNALMNSIPGILYLYDKKLRLVRWNENFSLVCGYPEEEMKDKCMLDFLPSSEHQKMKDSLSETVQQGYKEFETELLTSSGKSIPYKLTSVSTNVDETPLFAGVGVDISAQKKTEDHLIASRNMLENAQRIAHLGHWTLYHDTRRIHWSDEVYRILEIDPEISPPSFDGFIAQVHEDDRKKIIKQFLGGLKSRQPYSLVHRLRLADGHIKYVEHRGRSKYSETGKPLKSVGTLHDITEFVVAERTAAKHAEEARKSLMGTITAVAKALEVRDPYTAGHQERVAQIAVRIAQKLGLGQQRTEGILLGARIHDLGKIGVPAEILSKPARLTHLEYGLIQSHPQTGADILQGIKFPWPIKEIVEQHHERVDGSGYPKGLKGGQICFEARIVAVADVFEAMSAHRPYRASLGLEKAVEELTKNKGVFYDETVVDALLQLVEEDPMPFLP